MGVAHARGRRPVALAAAAFLSVWAAAAQGFVLRRTDGNPCGNAAPVRWQPPQARVDASGLPPDRAPWFSEAVRRWNRAMRGFRFLCGRAEGCDLFPAQGPFDGVTSVAVAADVCGFVRFAELPPDTIATTIVRFDAASGRLLDAHIAFNPARAGDLADDALFLQIAMHELGHVIGLEHTDACGGSGRGTLMASPPILLADPRITAPRADDLAGVDFLYPPGGAVCAGDCDGDGRVGVEELTRAVAIFLGRLPFEPCPAADPDGDCRVSVADLVAAVAAGLGRCAPGR